MKIPRSEHVVYTNCFFLLLFLHSKQFMYTTCSELGIFMYWTRNSMNNQSSYCGLIDTKIKASVQPSASLSTNHYTADFRAFAAIGSKICRRLDIPFYNRTIVWLWDSNKVDVLGFSVENTLHHNAAKYQSKHFHAAGCWLYRIAYIIDSK